MSLDRVLLAIDGSPGSAAAAAWTAELATATRAKVYVVHAYRPLDHLEELDPGHGLADIRSDIHEVLEREWCAPLREADVAFDVRIIDGDPADVILDAAGDIDADLIVMGARRQGRVRALALGSTSQRVIHESERPVTVLHPPTD